ncbi:MAG: sulfurtransferase TusA family protein [Pseudomonadota bacterium]
MTASDTNARKRNDGPLGAVAGETLVDARGHRCPVPTLRLRRAMEAAGAGGRARLLADDPMARIDVPHFAAAKGYVVEESGEVSGTLFFVVSAPA